MKNFWSGIFVLVAGTAVLIIACNKDHSLATSATPPGKQNIVLYMNDDPPPNLTSVLVDIRYVEVKIDTGTIHHDDDYYDGDHEGEDDHHDGEDGDHEGDHEDHHRDHFGKWDTLSITPGIYDLIKLKNGTDTLIANGFADTGRIIKIRITLGPNNSILTDSTHSYPLPICDHSPYVYVKVKSNAIDSLPGGQFRIRIDFDVAASIEEEDGHFCLRPRLRSYSDRSTGKIEGKVRPEDAKVLVMAYNSTDTAYAVPEDEGEFEIRGLKPANYSVLFKAAAPFMDSTINNVQVEAGQETKLPLVTLHQ